MTKQTAISLQILAKVAEGMDVMDALRVVCGADATDAMIDALYTALRGKAVR